MNPTTAEDLEQRPEHLTTAEAMADKPIDLKPKQARFIQSKAPFCAYGGGVGNGKTLAALIKVYLHCENNPGAYFLIGRKYFPELRDSTMRDFLQLMRGYGEFRSGDKIFEFPNGSEVIFRHLDNVDSLTNLNLSGYYVDQAEDIAEETFDYLNGRCRLEYNRKTGTMIKERIRIVTFNPKGHDWIWRLFHEKKNADGFDLDHPEDYFLEVATTYENRDNLPDDYIRSIEARPKEWKDRFIYGSFDVKAGRIFEEWNRALHVIPEKYRFNIPATWPKFRTIDHGQNNPTACLWCAVDPDNNIFVYREYYKPNAPVSQHVNNIKRLSMEWDGDKLVKGEYIYTVIDPSTHAMTRETKDGWKFSVADEYMDAGIPTIGGQNDVLAGINRVREYLKGNDTHYHPFLKVRDLEPGHPLYKKNYGRQENDPVMGAPRLYIFEDCKNLLDELPEYQWQPLKYNQIGMQNANEKPVKNFDHACFTSVCQVSTPEGSKSISELRAGDEVWTPFGPSKVLAVKMTGVKPVYDYGFAVATSDHPVLTDGGIYRVDALRYDNRIWLDQNPTAPKQFTSWEYLTAAILTQQNAVRDFIFDALLVRLLEARQATFTGTSGNLPTAQFLADMRYITRTATMTTRLNLLDLLPISNTGNSTPGEIPIQTTLTALGRLQNHGTVLTKDAVGIASMLETSGRNTRQQAQLVLSAVENTLLHSLAAASTVIQTAKPRRLDDAEVWSVATEHGMFFANGVLVSNCDALRYGIMSRPVGPETVDSIDYSTWNDPLALAMTARNMGLTKDDLLARRFRNSGGAIKHTDGGIKTRSGL